MATDTIERLAVLIEANTKSYENAMTKLQRQTAAALKNAENSTKALDERMKKLGETATAVLKQFGLGLGLEGLFKLGDAIKGVFETSHELVDTADRLGLTTAALQELDYAAGQSGVSTDQLGKDLGFFAKTAGQASEGQGQLAAILKLNGVALKDASGNVRPLNDLMRDYADLIGNAGGAAERATLETVAFGDSGADLDEMFREGAKGLDTLTSSADKLGLVIGDDALRRTADLDKEWTTLSNTIGNVFKESVLGAVKAVGDLGTALGNAVLVTGDANDLFNKLSAGKTGVNRSDFVGQHAGINIVNDFAALPGAAGANAPKPPPRKTLLPQAPDTAADAEKKRYADLSASIVTETANLTANSEEQAVNNNVLKLGTDATPAHIAAITAQTKAYYEASEQIGIFKDIAGDALSTFDSDLEEGKGLADAFRDSWVHALQDVIKKLEEAAIEAATSGLFGGGGLFSGGGIGGAVGSVLSGLFGGVPHKATGGGVMAGQLAIVGERQPELIQGPAMVRPLPKGNGGGPVMQNISIHVDGATGNTEVRAMVAKGVAQGLQVASKASARRHQLDA